MSCLTAQSLSVDLDGLGEGRGRRSNLIGVRTAIGTLLAQYKSVRMEGCVA